MDSDDEPQPLTGPGGDVDFADDLQDDRASPLDTSTGVADSNVHDADSPDLALDDQQTDADGVDTGADDLEETDALVSDLQLEDAGAAADTDTDTNTDTDTDTPDSGQPDVPPDLAADVPSDAYVDAGPMCPQAGDSEPDMSPDEPDVDMGDSTGTVLHEGPPLWRPLVVSDPPDLGHTPALAGGPLPQRTIVLTDVTAAAGLSGTAAGGNTHGVGLGFVDIDGDGWADIIIANGQQNRSGALFQSQLWRNVGDGTFEDVTFDSGFGAIMADRDAYSVAAADYDADGDVDLYITAQPFDVLLANDGDGTFTDMTTAARAGGPASIPGLVYDGKSKIAAFGDFDGDGWLDLVSASATLNDPGVYLLRNLGDGTFEDVTNSTGVAIHSRGNPCAVMWSDYDNDGDQDLWIWNDRGGHILLRNEGGACFSNATAFTNVSINNPMGIDAADIDHDLDLDLYVSNISHNPLLSNLGDGRFDDIGFVSGTDGPRDQYGWGLGFVDFDHDTFADIFVAQEDNREHLVFQNLRDVDSPRFVYTEVAHPSSADTIRAHNVAAAFADYDHDGRVDVLTGGTDGNPVVLYRNETDVSGRNWLGVRIDDVPGIGGIGGVSARVVVGTGDLIQFRDITAGSSRASQNELVVHFGLGGWDGADFVGVLWSDGRALGVTNVVGGQVLALPAE